MFLPPRPQPKVYNIRLNRDEVNRTTYRTLFRFDKESVEWLADTFIPPNTETRGGRLTPVAQMETTLAYLSDPGYQTSVAKIMGISQPTVSRYVTDTLERISAQHATWIKFPVTNTDMLTAKQRWSAKLGFRNTLGAIDCTHIRIDKPGDFGDDFVNRKNFPSFNVQATCDESYVFTRVDVGWPGSVHDSRIFKTSDLYRSLSRNRINTGFLLGDSGYGIAPYMMTPYRDPTTPVQKYYNKCHTSNRVVIENSFGHLKRRFPILRYGVRLKLENIPKCILSCFILHNISKYLGDPYDDLQDDADGEDDMVQEQKMTWK